MRLILFLITFVSLSAHCFDRDFESSIKSCVGQVKGHAQCHDNVDVIFESNRSYKFVVKDFKLSYLNSWGLIGKAYDLTKLFKSDTGNHSAHVSKVLSDPNLNRKKPIVICLKRNSFECLLSVTVTSQGHFSFFDISDIHSKF